MGLTDIECMSDHTTRHSINPEPLYSDLADDGDMLELVRFFVTELEDRLTDLRRAQETSDRDMLLTLAHQLKGAAAGYGYAVIGEQAAALEAAATASEVDADSVRQQLDRLARLCQRAEAGLEVQ